MILASISNERRLGGRVTGQLEVWEGHTGTLSIVELDKYTLSTSHQLWEQCNEGCGRRGQSCGRSWGANFGATDAPGQAGLG